MSLLSSSDVRDNVSASVDKVKQESDSVSVENMRSPGKLIDQVDSLDEAVEGLRQRQEDLVEEIRSVKLDSAVDDGEIKDEIEDLVSGSADLSGVEERLEIIEIAIDRLESDFDKRLDRVQDEIVDEASGLDSEKLESIEDRIDGLESDLDSSKIEEKVDRSELESRIDEVRNEHEESKNKVSSLDDRVSAIENSSDKVDQEEFEQLQNHVEELSNLLVEVVDN